MSLNSITLPGTFEVLATGSVLETTPAYQYEDGQRTEAPRLSENLEPLHRLRGVALLYEGELVPDVTVFITDDLGKQQTKVGTIFKIEGDFKVRAARGYGLTGTLEGSIIRPNQNREESR